VDILESYKIYQDSSFLELHLQHRPYRPTRSVEFAVMTILALNVVRQVPDDAYLTCPLYTLGALTR
jgi:hypothetical protein